MGNTTPGPQDGWCQGTVIQDGTLALCMASVPSSPDDYVGSWSLAERLGGALYYAAKSVGGAAGSKLRGLISPLSLGIMGVVLTAWASSHAIGVGEAMDSLVMIGGLIFLGYDAVTAMHSFGKFVYGVLRAQTDGDLRHAGENLAKAIAIVGIDVVMIWLTCRAIKAYKGTGPTVTGDPSMPVGAGTTDPLGNVRYSTAGPVSEQALARYHEMVHSFLSPKMGPLKNFRASLAMSLYERSALLQFLEEALAEGYAQMRVNGFEGLPTALKFTFGNPAYSVTLSALLTEGAIGTVVVGGVTYFVHLAISEAE